MGNSVAVKGDFKQEIFNEVNENMRALERLFPSVVKDGQVDFEALKEELGNFEEVGPEKYGLTWSGKQDAKKIAQEDIVGKTLKFIPEDSKNPDTTENLYIEGDNLEVLKLLRQNYYGAIKMIYIDPPYNTGNDFVYNDNFNMDKNESDMAEGDVSQLGERYIINLKSKNKFHAIWLSMMYSRLKVAKDLLRDDGVIFITIDDNEQKNLKSICDEVFGESNFVGDIVWRSSDNSNNNALTFSEDHNYILVYSKQPEWRPNFINNENKRKHFKNPDNDPHGPWFDGNPVNNPGLRPNLQFDITTPSGKIIKHPANGWRWSWKTIEEKMKTGEIRFSDDETRLIRRTYLNELEGLPPSSLCIDFDVTGHTRRAKYELKKLFPEVPVTSLFSTPKPTLLIDYLMKIGSDENAIIMDFFSGSATTAHAVMQLNANDNENRKFIMVQLLEKCDSEDDSIKKYFNICEIGKERIRRAGDKIKEENKDKEGIENLDIGFKVFRVGDTNIRWNYESANLKTLASEITVKDTGEQTSFNFIAATKQVTIDDVVSPKDRLDFMPYIKDIDVVYEILLRQRDVPLSAKIELLKDIGERTYIFADSYLVCLEEDITNDLIEKLAAINPLPIKFVLRDSAFGDDIALKDEAHRRLKALIERNTGEIKKTYTVEFI